MKVRILTAANKDLIDGYWFYEKQGEGLGTYFLDTLFSDIDSLRIYAGLYSKYMGKISSFTLETLPICGIL